jgi:hypothetical protein
MLVSSHAFFVMGMALSALMAKPSRREDGLAILSAMVP